MPQFRPLSQTKFINDANLVSYWKLDEASGNAIDSKGSNTLVNTGTAVYSAAKFGNGTTFVATKYLSIADAAQTGLDIIGNFTFSMWIYTNVDFVDTNEMFLIDKYNGTGNKRGYLFELYNTGGATRLQVNLSPNGTTVNVVYLNWALLKQTWYYLTATYTASTHLVNFYVNGLLLGAAQDITTTSIYNNDQPFYLGCYNGTSYAINLVMDDVAIFSRALSFAEVNELYQGMTLGEYLPNSNTKLLLHLNGNSTDSSGNGNNGVDTAITYSQANGKFGQGAGFGSTSKILKTSFSSTGQHNGTWSQWIKTATTTGQQTIIEHDDSASLMINIEVYNHKIRVGTWNGSTDPVLSSGASVDDGVWHNVIVTKNGAGVIIYVDGNNSGAANLNDITFGGNFCVGRDNVNNVNSFIGSIDEVIYEPRVWSASEIKKYFTMAKGRFGII